MLFLTGYLVLLWIWLPQSQEIWALPWIALVITFSLLSILKHCAILIFFLHISFQNISPCHYALMHSKFQNMFLTYSCGYLLHMAIQNLTSGPNYHIPQYNKLFKEAGEQVAWVIFILHWKENEIKKRKKKIFTCMRSDNTFLHLSFMESYFFPVKAGIPFSINIHNI